MLAALDFPIDHFVRSYARRRELLIDMLSDRLKFTAPAGGFYAFVKIPESLGMNDREFAQEAVSRGVLVIPGRIFSKRADHFRISITCPEERLQVGLERVCSLIGG